MPSGSTPTGISAFTSPLLVSITVTIEFVLIGDVEDVALGIDSHELGVGPESSWRVTSSLPVSITSMMSPSPAAT